MPGLGKAGDEAFSSLSWLLFAGGDDPVHRRVSARRRGWYGTSPRTFPTLRQLQGLRAAGDDARARVGRPPWWLNTQGAPGSISRSGGAKAGHQCVHSAEDKKFLRTWRPRLRRHRPRRHSLSAEHRHQSPAAGRLDHHPGRSPRNFLLTTRSRSSARSRKPAGAQDPSAPIRRRRSRALFSTRSIFGLGAYGVAAASLLYFDKSVHELTIAEAAYLAALPKAPTLLHPFRQRDRAVERRNYVIDRMKDDGYVTAQVADKAKREPLTVTARPTGAHILPPNISPRTFGADLRKVWRKRPVRGGLSVRTTLRPEDAGDGAQGAADGLVHFDEPRAIRGAWRRSTSSGDWGPKLADIRALNDIGWKSGGGAGDQRSGRPHRLPARARDRRRGVARSPGRHRSDRKA